MPAQSREDADSAGRDAIDWAAALGEHRRWLRTVVTARVGEAQAVEDVMQEVSVAAIEENSPIADRTKIAPWLYRLAVRKSLLYRRAAGRRRKLTDQLVERHPPKETSADPLDWLLAEERRRMVRETIKKLPRRDAEMLLLKYTEDWSYRQIAEHLGISRSAVEARLHRARRRLRSQLAAVEVKS